MGDVEEAALYVASEIKALKDDPGLDISHYKHFGVAVRSNAEAYTYALEMLKKGIPFKSNANFFNDPLTKSVLAWLTIAEVGTTGDAGRANAALEAALKYPRSGVGEKFKGLLSEWGRGNYIRWLLEGGGDRIILQKSGKPDSDYVQNIRNFIDNVRFTANMVGSPSEILNRILSLGGSDDFTILESLVDDLKNDDVKMTELALALGDNLTDEDIKEEAMAPLKPLIGVLNGHGSLTPAMAYLNQLAKANEKLGTQQGTDPDEELRDAVTINTMHQWKGLEVPHMYIPMVGGRFPRCNPDKGYAEQDDALAAERRLAYVAITRAEERCTVLDIPDPKTGIHSQFISEACIPYDGEGDATQASDGEGTLGPDDSHLDDDYMDNEEAPF
jgi:DNA helicase-2/ATP-dependent DNA helicase PcrA